MKWRKKVENYEMKIKVCYNSKRVSVSEINM